MIALLAALAQIAITAMVPLPVMPIVADDYARFAAEFGPDAKICTTGTEAPASARHRTTIRRREGCRTARSAPSAGRCVISQRLFC
jgi:hypothetical protein